MKHKFLGYYDYTVILTYTGMMAGFLGIVCTMEGKLHTALLCLMTAGVCDMFDGAVASIKKRSVDEKCFGIQIDSLSDLICFGVLPALITCRLNGFGELTYAVCALYVLCALIRLAYFNVDEQNRQRETDGRREYYYGLPVTTMSAIFPLLFAVSSLTGLKKGISTTVALAIAGILFLSPFKIKKPEMIGKVALGICGMFEFLFLFLGIGEV